MSAPTVSIHDHYQLELKLSHPLDVPVSTFECWLYFPNSLGIDEPQFHKDDFYGDMTAYTRFQTPRMSIERLLDERDTASPFAWLVRQQAELCSGMASPFDYAAAVRAIRMFGAIYRAAVRDSTDALGAGLCAGASPAARAEHLAAAGSFLGNSIAVLQRIRRYRVETSSARLPADLDAALGAVDDFLSLHALEAWFSLLRGLQGAAPEECLAPALRAAITAETRHRVDAGMLGAPVDDARGNEGYIARVNQLKKWVLGVLHLRLVSNRQAERAREFAFSFAAAVAMSVAVVLQLVAMWTVGTPKAPQLGGTLYAFIGLAVGGYILKDGIKDRLKGWFQAGIPHWLFDRRHDMCVGTSGTRFGAVEGTVTRLDAWDVSPAVAQLREAGEDPLFAGERADEDVIHYRRLVRINASLAHAQAPEMVAVDEIIRLSVVRWLRRMDEPLRPLSRLGEDGQVGRVSAAKTYRVTMILTLPSGGAIRHEKLAVVVCRDGIVRIERER